VLRAGSHALLTRPPLGAGPKPATPFDLHVLGAPPAFVLSQDQTLSFSPRPQKVAPSGRAPGPNGITAQGRPSSPQGRPRIRSKATGPKSTPPTPAFRSPWHLPAPSAAKAKAGADSAPPPYPRCLSLWRPQSRRPRIPSSHSTLSKDHTGDRGSARSPRPAGKRCVIGAKRLGNKPLCGRIPDINLYCKVFNSRLRLC
jgi:hypothetical protein